MTPSLVEILRSVPLFARVDANSLSEITDRCRRRQFPADEALFHEGDPGYTLYVVVSGAIRIQTTNPDGETVHLADRGAGEAVGEMSLIDGQPRMADGVTAVPSDLLMLDRDDFLHCLRHCPDAALAVMAVMAARLRQSASDLGRQRRHGLLGKVAAILLELADSYGEEIELGLRISRPITHQKIAQRVGAARESVSRTLASLKQSGILATEGRRLIILDRKKLEHYAAR